MRFEHHIFVCANQKAEGKKCCGEQHGMELVAKFRDVLKEKGLNTVVRAQRAGCIDACSQGPSLVIYPSGTYYGNVTLADVERIVSSHIVANTIVSDLVVKF